MFMGRSVTDPFNSPTPSYFGPVVVWEGLSLEPPSGTGTRPWASVTDGDPLRDVVTAPPGTGSAQVAEHFGWERRLGRVRGVQYSKTDVCARG